MKESLSTNEIGPGEHDPKPPKLEKVPDEIIKEWCTTFEENKKNNEKIREILEQTGLLKKQEQRGEPKDDSKGPKQREQLIEREAKEIADGRGSLLGTILERVAAEWKNDREGIVNISEDQRRLYELLKKVPLLRGSVVLNEAILKAEPGKKLSTKEALAKYATCFAMFGGDILWLAAKLKGKKVPENVFNGRTLEWIEQMTERAKKEDPEGNKTRALNAVSDFLHNNPDATDYVEGYLSDIANGKAKATA